MNARQQKDALIAAEPRVQLLPPVVKQRERNRRTRRLLAFAVVVSVAVAGAGIGLSYLQATQAQAALAAEQERTAVILAQQSEFSEATKINTLVAETVAAQKLVTTTEVEWSEIFAELSARLPAGYGVVKASISSPPPWEAPLVPSGVLRESGLADVTVSMQGAEYRQAADFAYAVSFLDGVSDFLITRTDLGNGGYTTVMTFTLDLSRVSDRFLDDVEDGEVDDEEIVTEADGTDGQSPVATENEEATE